MIKYLKMLKTIFKNAYVRDKKIPGVVSSKVVYSLLDVFITLAMFSAIFSNITALAGWNYYQVIFLYLIMKIMTLFVGLIARGGINSMASTHIRTGYYDFYLVKPLNSLLFVSISEPRIYNIITMVLVTPMAVYAAMHTGINIYFINVLWFLVLMVFGTALYYFLNVITVVPVFWFVRLFSLKDVMNRASMLMRYPAGIYSRVVKIILFAIFPIVTVTYFPARTLFYPPDTRYIIFMLLITAAFGFIAFGLWKLGERNYGSASS